MKNNDYDQITCLGLQKKSKSSKLLIGILELCIINALLTFALASSKIFLSQHLASTRAILVLIHKMFTYYKYGPNV